MCQESTARSPPHEGGPGRGIAQWSSGGRWDTTANDNAIAYATKQSESVWSLQLQLEFIWYELQTFSGYGLSSLTKTTNLTDATVAFETDFEGCGVCQNAKRIAYAQAVLSAYGSDVVGKDGGTVDATVDAGSQDGEASVETDASASSTESGAGCSASSRSSSSPAASTLGALLVAAVARARRRRDRETFKRGSRNACAGVQRPRPARSQPPSSRERRLGPKVADARVRSGHGNQED